MSLMSRMSEADVAKMKREIQLLKKDNANLKETLEAERRVANYLWRDLKMFACDPAHKAHFNLEPPPVRVGRDILGLRNDDVVRSEYIML